MSESIDADISKIIIDPDRQKELVEGDVIDLIDSIREVSVLLHPITLERDNGNFRLIAGLHRIEAFRRMGRGVIPAYVVELNAKQRELAEIDENLIRGKLHFIDRAEQLKKRKQIYEELHPESKAGRVRAAGMNKKLGRNVSETDSPTFSDNTARKSGLSQRTIQQDIHLAETLPADVKEAVKDLCIPKADALKLARMSGEKRKAVIRKMKDGKAKSVAEASRELVVEAKADGSANALPDDCRLICADIALLSAHVEAESVDVVITEPPCKKDALGIYETLAVEASKVLKDGGSVFVLVEQSYLPEVLTLMARHLTYHWALVYMIADSQTVQSKNVETFWKPVLWFVKGKYKGDDSYPCDVYGQSEDGISELVEKFSYPGQAVLDPFVGNGEEVALKSVAMRRKFIGLDKDSGVIEMMKANLTVETVG